MASLITVTIVAVTWGSVFPILQRPMKSLWEIKSSSTQQTQSTAYSLLETSEDSSAIIL